MPSAPLSPGLRFADRYTLKRRLGLGRLGEVWLANDTRLDMDVALKFFDAYEQRATLDAAARKMMKLTHPHLVRVYDFFDDSERCALVMEYLEGGSLARKLKEIEAGCFEPAQIQDWVKQLWSALAELQEVGLVHGNLNLANLGLAGTGEIKIMESGFFEIRTAALNPDMTFSYLPCLTPQVISGKTPGVMDDCYAAGACIYELLTGKPAFLGANLPTQIQERDATAVALRRAELGVGSQPVPEDWEQWIARALAKSPYDRPQAAEMRDLLRDAPPVSTVTAEQAAATQKQANSPAARLADMQAKIRTLPKQAWIGLGAAAALAVFYFACWQPAQSSMSKMEDDFRALRRKNLTEPPAILVKHWAEFQTNYEQPIPFTNRDTDMLTDASDYQMAKQKEADDQDRLAKAEAQRLQEKRESEIKKLTESLLTKLDSTQEISNDKAIPVAQKLKRWQTLQAEFDERTAPYKDSDDLPASLKVARKDVEEKVAYWTSEQKRQEMEYANYQQKLSNELDRLKALFADSAQATSAKKLEIDKVLAAFLNSAPPGSQDSHMAMISQLQGWSKEWAGKMEDEIPKVPLALKDLFANTPYKDLAEDKLKALLGKVYSGYGIDPKTDPDRSQLHAAIIAAQRSTAEGLVDGKIRLEDLSKAELPVTIDEKGLNSLIASLTKPVTSGSSGSTKRKSSSKPPPKEPNFGQRMLGRFKDLIGKDDDAKNSKSKSQKK